ncbi:nose resistant to fluoxetine protein 6-like [Schistocerca nitens]|uniref:nose resistant to fluoxetine protein 6-like n=1 Tax=Schistocerca nitens TaxID=7011 RepID=UPI0021192261|nr:nose resistant to fluoxetine protein 6-like [Schistocerca nitens]
MKILYLYDTRTGLSALVSLEVSRAVDAAVEALPEGSCRWDATNLLEALRNGSEDALRVLDATGKPGSSILRGNLRLLGDFDECVAIPASRYCLADVRLPAPADIDNATARLLSIATAGRWLFEDIPRRSGPMVLPIFSLTQWGICVPISCDPDEVSAFVTSFLENLCGLKLTIDVPHGACTSKLPSLSTADIVILSTILVVIIFIVLCTFWDLVVRACQKHNEEEKASNSLANLAKGMSLCSSWKNLWNSHRTNSSIACIDGIRAFSALWVIMTHKILQMSQEPSVNKVILLESTRDIPKMPLLNSMINVDSFFLISGMLRAMNFMRDVQQRGGFWIATGILQRLLRLTPAYAVVLAVYACLLPYFGSGPEWNTQVGYNSKMCKQHWMFNIMYVNNYINYENMCMLQSWYLSADMQLFVCALIILIPLYYWHKIGELLLGLVIFVSVALPFATVLIRRLPGLYQPTQPDDQLYEYMRDVYMATHNRMTPYLVGLALGYLLHRIKGQPVTKSKNSALLESPHISMPEAKKNNQQRIDNVSNILLCRNAITLQVNSPNTKQERTTTFFMASDSREMLISSSKTSLWKENFNCKSVKNDMSCATVEHKVLIGVGWTVSLLVLGAVVWGPYHLLQECASLTTTTLESAAYAALHRFTWALALGWIIIACYHNLRFGVVGDAVKGILESSTWQPLSRLSYCIFLTHIAVLLINSGRIRTPIFMDEYLLMHSYAGDLAIVLLISMALHLFVEAPSLFLARTIFSRQGNQQQSSKIVKNQTPHQRNTVDQKKKQQRWQHVSPTDIPTSSECPVGQP